jgi:hypothetical protein
VLLVASVASCGDHRQLAVPISTVAAARWAGFGDCPLWVTEMTVTATRADTDDSTVVGCVWTGTGGVWGPREGRPVFEATVTVYRARAGIDPDERAAGDLRRMVDAALAAGSARKAIASGADELYLATRPGDVVGTVLMSSANAIAVITVQLNPDRAEEQAARFMAGPSQDVDLVVAMVLGGLR